MSSSNRTRNFRRRAEADDDESSTPAAAASTSAATVKTQTLAKPKSSKPPEAPKRLSFVDDEEEDEDASSVTAARRPPASRNSSSAAGSSHKHTSAKDRRKAAPLAPTITSNVQPQTGEYTKEKLLELQKNARPLGSMPRPQLQSTPTSLPDMKPPKIERERPAEPLIVLKGLLKPTSSVEKPLEEEEEEEEEEEDGTDNGNDRGGADKGMKLPAIPDRATIDAIRAKRQQFQQPRHAPDYISLDVSRPSAGGSSDEEDNEFPERTAFLAGKLDGRTKNKGVFSSTGKKATLAESKALDVTGFSMVVDDMNEEDEDDDEERKWEEEQFRKGFGRRIDEPSTQKVNSISIPVIPAIKPQLPPYAGVSQQQMMSTMSMASTSFGVSRSAEALSIPQEAEVSTLAMQENISRLKETHKRVLNSLVKTDTDISVALSEITNLEKALKVADDKYVFMQELRDFISVTCDFLNDKAFFIEELEEQMQQLHERRAIAVVERRAADVADEANEVDSAVNAAISVLNRGSGSAYVAAAAAAAQAAATAARECANLPAELDDFGRDLNLQKRMDITRRAESRKRRKARAEFKRLDLTRKNNGAELVEGEVSTDESDSESSAYDSSRNELLQAAKDIFSDAAEEYSNLKIVKERFEKWKSLYPSSYRDAYVSLSAPSIFSPYVRLELLKWDPLYHNVDFNDMEWHELLFDYGIPAKDQDMNPDDSDANLVPEVVEKVVLPILHHELAHCWDTLSTRRTRNAVSAMEMVISYLPPTSKALHELLVVVRGRFTEAIDNLIVPVWSTVVVKAVPEAAKVAAYRFGMSVRLLKNICLWKDILSLPILEKLALEELMKGKLLPHVRSIMPNIHDAIRRTERIVSSLSGVWSGGPRGKSEPTHKLQSLIDCVAELGSRLERRHEAGVSEEETRTLARRLKNMLVALDEYDRARTLSRTFQLKEAL